ncbi:uncharacterized protein LOC113315838 [Papaver somniferum]|uniref:uncharacterized protein LOC113315838 n=1 Tax=Papaver somniferum TaxID=3469 RepID=UPI000E6F5C72|nr:uncharacterized protein LOC113315838 [Papaver somniferum]
MKDNYKAIANHRDHVFWHPLVLFKLHIPRNSFISWVALHGILKTRDKLVRWGVININKCVLCEDGIESEAHIFHDFPFFALIWNGLLLKLGFCRGNTPTWEVEIQWCITFFAGNDLISTIKKLVFNGFIYQIWSERNNRIFNAKNKSAHKVSLLIIQDIQLKLSAHPRTICDTIENKTFMMKWNFNYTFTQIFWKQCWWIGPEEDEIMISTNGSLKETSVGYGALLRNKEGQVTDCAYGGSYHISVASHELQGVELGLNLAIENHIPKIHINLDSMAIFLLLSKADLHPPWSLIHIWRRVCALLQNFERVKFSHCYREINRATDFLASIHPEHGIVRLLQSQFSLEFQKILYEDSTRKVYWR